MRLILVRHGNTFGPGDKVVWCGARTDLALVEKGHEQAQAVGAILADAAIAPVSIICGPLIRTRQTAAAIADKTGFEAARVTIDERLREVDYGSWEGRSNDEIREEFGDEDLTRWQTDGIRPENRGWSPDEDTIRDNWNALVAEAQETCGDKDDIVVVSSNGFFRFAGLAMGADHDKTKMATGALSLVEVTGGGYRIMFWNRRPDDLDPGAFQP